MIRRVRLRNFKCFHDQGVDLGRMTVLAGLNGTGKSSLIQSLLLLRQSHQQQLLRKVGLALTGELVQLGTAQDALFEGATEDTISLEITFDNCSASWSFARQTAVTNVLPLVTHSGYDDCEPTLFGDDCQYLQAERLGPRVAFEMSDFAVRQHRQLGTRGEYTAHFLSVFGQEKIPNVSLSHPDAASQLLIPQVEAWLSEISPGIQLHSAEHTGTDLISLLYSFTAGQEIGSNKYRATNVGFGITYALPIITATLASRAGALLFIENPEAHLHPRGQVCLGQLLTRAAACGVQVVVETHSDHVLNGIRLTVHEGLIAPEHVSLNFFERRNSLATHVIVPRIDRNGRIDIWPKGFFDEWDKSLESLIEPAK